jgi:hypothetical protein
MLWVFDLTHIWRTDTSTGEVGLGADGKYHARCQDAASVVQAIEAFDSPV